MKKIFCFYALLCTLFLSGNATAACTCTTLETNSAGQVIKEDCGTSCGIKEYRYEGDTRYTTTTKTESGNKIVREETHISAKNNGSYSVQTSYKETTYDAQNNAKKIEDRYYTVTENQNGTKTSSLTSGVVTNNTYENGLLVSATETNKVKGSNGLVNEGTRNKVTYTYDDNQNLVLRESVLQVSVGTNKWEDADPPTITVNRYASNGSYETFLNGVSTGKYNADGSQYQAKRIYTVKEASSVVRKGANHLFKIRYR